MDFVLSFMLNWEFQKGKLIEHSRTMVRNPWTPCWCEACLSEVICWRMQVRDEDAPDGGPDARAGPDAAHLLPDARRVGDPARPRRHQPEAGRGRLRHRLRRRGLLRRERMGEWTVECLLGGIRMSALAVPSGRCF